MIIMEETAMMEAGRKWKNWVPGGLLLASTLMGGQAQAVSVDIASLTVDSFSLGVTIDGDGTYDWGGTLAEPILIQMGVYQDPIVEWGTSGSGSYAKIYATAANGAPPPNGTVDFDLGTIDVDFTSVYANAEINAYSLTLGPVGNLSGSSTPPDGYTLDWNSTWNVSLGGGGGGGIHPMTASMDGAWRCSECGSNGGDLSGTVSLVFSGTVTPVPVPAAIWLFGSGLLGLAGMARRA
ncbi:VPLPA-CTERM sorting domain-containing protein [Thiohalobacter sp. IOR34]|uniref:VPLPA-CTERM sorting domain-containing protein n=1 Tax=Thiohalobacter sp. IOR34 TaxID=3057176 RepID=UPI0025AED0DF|nr:VPLPA-CTERM sorting domain-containing protein [Thiohalobacter sp. IOR34]WJW75205.1 VPLPA-CTERM sorting domain-containing protein [Thiohalobacter sp. IOR34]